MKKYGVGGPTTKAQSTPTEQSSQPNTPPVGTNKLTGNPRLKNGGTKTSYKTGGMVNSNAKVTASKKATGKVGGISKAPKTALPKAKYGMAMRKK